MSYGRRQIEDYLFKNNTPNLGNDDGASRIVLVQDFKSVQLELAADNDADMKITFYKSDQEEMPDPSVGPSFDNSYEPIAVRDNDNSVTYNGSTGIVLTGNEQLSLEVQSNGSRWVFAVISDYQDGEVQVRVKAYTNE